MSATSRWPITSEPHPGAETAAAAAASLRKTLKQAPVLSVLRADDPITLIPVVAELAAAGIVHVELAWSAAASWCAGAAALRQQFPRLHVGAASIVQPAALEQVAAAGLTYAVSPVLDQALLQRATALGLAFVPGVMTPTEVHQARAWGATIVKLFPARSLGPGYWASLRAPLAGLPFCIAAGGLAPADVLPWLEAGVDAVALGQSLFSADGLLDPQLQQQLRRLRQP